VTGADGKDDGAASPKSHPAPANSSSALTPAPPASASPESSLDSNTTARLDGFEEAGRRLADEEEEEGAGAGGPCLLRLGMVWRGTVPEGTRAEEELDLRRLDA
jgi:hypothetical protein